MDDFDFNHKTVLIRVDINSHVDPETGKVSMTERIEQHAQTIKELADKGGRVVVLAHQGRPGDSDFVSLGQHAVLLSDYMGLQVKYVDDIVGDSAADAIRNLSDGEVLLLDNVRKLEDEMLKRSAEEHAESQIVRALSPFADVFVNDAFSAAHRSQASLVGFTVTLPSAMGRVMEKEVRSLERVMHSMERPTMYLLGGAKPEEAFKIMRNMLGVADTFMTGGVIGNIFLLARGYELGENYTSFMENKGYLSFISEAQKMLEEYPDTILAPVDVALDINGHRQEIIVEELPTEHNIYDIGERTIEKYTGIVSEANTIVFKGPLGVYEKPEFAQGTRKVLEAVTKSNAFSLTGGGDTTTALDALNIPKDGISHISLAGGALLSYLAGEILPVLEALRKSSRNK